MQTKKCSKCGLVKEYSEYFKDNNRPIGIRCKCKSCCKKDTQDWRTRNRSEYNNYVAQWRSKNPDKQHATEIKRHYGLSSEDYNKMLVSQDYKCFICSKLHDTEVKRGRLHVDHCHETNVIRGLLCATCNSGIGGLKHNIRLLEKSIEYLRKFEKI